MRTTDMTIRKGTADLATVLARMTGPRIVLLTWLGLGIRLGLGVGLGVRLGLG